MPSRIRRAARVTRAWRMGAVAVGAAALCSGAASAQSAGSLALQGSVVRQTLDGPRVVPLEVVTLHRVNAQAAGPVDSVRTNARGEFRFRVSVPDSQSMYLVSANYGGIAYFSQPAQLGQSLPPAEIVVYDTTSADVRLQLQGRHLVVSSPDADGLRSVIDVLEIENDTVLTRVAGASNRPTFSLLLPDGARNVKASQGEQGGGAVEVRGGRAELFAPLSPGVRQLVLTYELPPNVLPLGVPLERAVNVLEVLLEEPGASAEGGGLVSQGGVAVDGKAFTRYLGQNAPANAVLTLRGASAEGLGGTPPWVLPLVLTVITLGAILLLARRPRAAMSGPATFPVRAPTSASAIAPRTTASESTRATLSPAAGNSAVPDHRVHQLARQIAALDALLDGGGAHADSRADLERHRRTLKDELVGSLADWTPVS